MSVAARQEPAPERHVGDVIRMGLSLALLALVASPLLREPDHDSYPLSTYPMFARIIDHPWLTVAEGLDDAGNRQRLPPEIVASDEPMQAMRTLRLTAEQGRAALRQLCARIAQRVARDARFANLTQARIVRARFDPLTYFEGNPQPERARNLTTCKVPRRD